MIPEEYIPEENQSMPSVDSLQPSLSIKTSQHKEIEDVIISPIADLNQNIEENEIIMKEEISSTDNELYKEDQIVSNDNIQFCQHCGKRVERDSLFCKHCGKSLRGKNSTNLSGVPITKYFKNICTRFSYRCHFRKPSDTVFPAIPNRKFRFSLKWKICHAIFLLILLSIFIWWFILLKFEKVCWLGNSYDAAIVISCIGLIFLLFTWLLGLKQTKIYKVWRSYLLWLCCIIYILGALISAVCFIGTLSSYRLKEAKEIYANNKALESNDIKVRNNELNRRFEQFWVITSGHRGKSYPSLEYLISNDSRYFELLNIEAQQNNGLAQGILGEYYFSTGTHQLSDATNEYGHITDENLYNRGLNNMERAFYWWKQASENKDARGMYRMGNCYAKIIEIDGIDKDLNKAYEYWTKASEKGYGMAYKRLGDLFGTWEYLGAFSIDLPNEDDTNSEVLVQGVDVYGTDENPKFSKPFRLPKEWKHDVSIAREYWQKAIECGGAAADEARKYLEKVYPEEKR